MVVPAYDEAIVNNYLIAVKRESYIISVDDADYDIWLEFLNIQKIFDYDGFTNVDAGIALVRFYYENSKSCGMCECYPPLLASMAYGGGQFFEQSIYNVKKPEVICCEYC